MFYRYFHSAVCVPAVRAMFVFGGLVEQAGAIKEMWRYNLDTNRWSKQVVSAVLRGMGYRVGMVV